MESQREQAEASARLLDVMAADRRDQQARKTFIRFTEEDARCLTELAAFAREHVDDIVEEFYANLLQFDEMKAIFRATGVSVESLKATQRQYVLELFGGAYDDDYFERRLRIGVVHNRVGLSPRWYLGAYSVQRATQAAVMAAEQGVKASETGAAVARRAGEAIRLLAESLAESAQAAQQILVSAQQQVAGTDQVALAMHNIHQASTQNMASTRQVERAARDLAELAQRLQALLAASR